MIALKMPKVPISLKTVLHISFARKGVFSKDLEDTAES